MTLRDKAQNVDVDVEFEPVAFLQVTADVAELLAFVSVVASLFVVATTGLLGALTGFDKALAIQALNGVFGSFLVGLSALVYTLLVGFIEQVYTDPDQNTVGLSELGLGGESDEVSEEVSEEELEELVRRSVDEAVEERARKGPSPPRVEGR